MQEKSSHSQPAGICHRLITFIMNSLTARSFIKRVTLGHPMPQDQQSLIPAAKPNGVQAVYLQALQTPENDSGIELRVHYKQADYHDFESWTQIDELGTSMKAHVSESKGNSLLQIKEITDSEVKPISISTTTSQIKDPKKVMSFKDAAELEKEESKKKKGKGVVSSETFTLAMEPEDDYRYGLRCGRPLFHVLPNINEKSEAFIRSRKEAMRRSYSLEPWTT